MDSVTATEAKNRLGRLLEACQRGPVVIAKSGRRHSVLVSAEQYDALVEQASRAPVAKARSRADPGCEFYEKYKDWVDEQNRHFEKYGVWNQEFRTW